MVISAFVLFSFITYLKCCGHGIRISFKRNLGASCMRYLYVLQLIVMFLISETFSLIYIQNVSFLVHWGILFYFFCHNLAVPFLRWSFTALFLCPKLLEGQCNATDEWVSRKNFSHIFYLSLNLQQPHCLYLRDILHASADLSHLLCPVPSLLYATFMH